MSKNQITLEEVQQLYREGQLDAARNGYMSLLEDDPQNVNALHMLGLLCAEEGNFDAAQSYLHKALTIAPDDPTLYLHLANIFKVKGATEKATQLLLELIDQYPQFVSAYNNLGTVYYREGKWVEAIKAFHAAIDLQPDYVDAYYNLGLALNKNHSYIEAINAFRALLELSPDHPGARFQLGALHMQQNKFEEASEQFLKIERQHPFHFETQSNLASCYLRLGQLDNAKNHYLKALDIHKEDADLLFNLGVINTQQGNLQEAIKYYLQCIEVNPNHYNAYNNLGVAHLSLRKNAEALKYFKLALQKKFPDDKALQHTIDILSKNKDLNTSPIDYVRALFDSYADHYDQHLAQTLNYQVPELFQQILKDNNVFPTKNTTVLDIGCGTGLCGAIIPVKKNLVGVDVSERMLAEAKQKNIYDELVQADILAYLLATKVTFDLMLAGDVFVYYGDLSALFPLIARVLKPGGVIVFNAEISPTSDFGMTDSGRFAHSKKYIDELSALTHMQIISYKVAPLRTQNGLPVLGHLYLLKKI